MTTITYADLDRVLKELGAGMDAAEAHGCLSGALCVEQDFRPAEWLLEVLPDEASGELPAGTLGVFEAALAELRQSLDSDELAFAPLLPVDSLALRQRVDALASWCAGFLYGLGRAGTLGKLPGDVDEITRDLAEIARASLAFDEGGEASEQDYAELVEFIRASVQLAWEELRGQRAAAAASAHPHH
jgi:uncharacterized protein